VKEESLLAERKSFCLGSPAASRRKMAEGCGPKEDKFKSISSFTVLNMLDISKLRLPAPPTLGHPWSRSYLDSERPGWFSTNREAHVNFIEVTNRPVCAS
jgi:hypothetical protein